MQEKAGLNLGFSGGEHTRLEREREKHTYNTSLQGRRDEVRKWKRKKVTSYDNWESNRSAFETTKSQKDNNYNTVIFLFYYLISNM